MRERKGVDPAWIHALFFCNRYRKDGDSNMAYQSPHTSIHYGSTKPATDVKVENIIHYLCDSGPVTVNAVLANVLMEKDFYGSLQGT